MVQVKKRKNIIKLKRNNKKEEEKDTKLSMSTFLCVCIYIDIIHQF